MKKLFLFASLLCAGMLSAQTIVIDGAKADWADVPMLTQPGAADVVKMIVPQTGATLPSGAAYCLMVESQNATAMANYPVIYTDADQSNTTGTAPWICPAMGYDYEMATWSTNTAYAASADGAIHEMCIDQAAFSGVAYTGTVNTYLTFNWGALYIPTDPVTDGWNWSADVRHPFHVAPYSIASLAGEHTAVASYSSHYALTLGADNNFNFCVTGGSQDTAFWVSWPVELAEAGTYNVSANINSTDNASCDLALVNMATNQIVATYTSADIWAPAGETAFGAWDLSAVPTGKYMLRMKNHVAWSHMVLTSITLTKQGTTPTALDEVANGESQKVIRNGQVLILRDGKTYNALGAEIR